MGTQKLIYFSLKIARRMFIMNADNIRQLKINKISAEDDFTQNLSKIKAKGKSKMLKQIIKENRTRLFIISLVMMILLLIVGILEGVFQFRRQKNDSYVQEQLEQLQYTIDRVEEDKEQIFNLLEQRPMSDKTEAMLYYSLARVYYLGGDWGEYNKCVELAVSYFSVAGEKEQALYVLNDYIGVLYAGDNYELARQQLLQIAEMQSMDEDVDMALRAKYYLSFADVEEKQGDLEAADQHLQKAAQWIAQIDSPEEKKLQQAKYDILVARRYLELGEPELAEEVLKDYSGDSLGNNTQVELYSICDFWIPYNELSAKLALERQDTESLEQYCNEYMEKCEQLNFQNMQIELLTYITEHENCPEELEEDYVRLLAKKQEAYLADLKHSYGQLLKSQMNMIPSIFEETYMLKQWKANIGGRIGIALFVLWLAAMVVVLTIYKMEHDALTGLKARQKYESDRRLLQKRKTAYGLIIFDIDDFKRINDTLGHKEGDRVLALIAAIFKQHAAGKGNTVYRYGGEEFCVICRKQSADEVVALAEKLRKLVEAQTIQNMRITISGGIGMSFHGKNPFLEADQALYVAKNSGKNKTILQQQTA